MYYFVTGLLESSNIAFYCQLGNFPFNRGNSNCFDYLFQNKVAPSHSPYEFGKAVNSMVMSMNSQDITIYCIKIALKYRSVSYCNNVKKNNDQLRRNNPERSVQGLEFRPFPKKPKA